MVVGDGGSGGRGSWGMAALTGWSAVALSSLFWFLKPSMLDGDGLQHAGDAIFHPAFGAMDLKHLLVPAVMKVAVVLAGLVGRGGRVIDFLLAENALATVVTFVILARFVFPRVIQDRVVALLSALGTVLSFGVLSRSACLEVYSLALLADVSLVAFCLSSRLGTRGGGVVLGVLSALAVSIHVTNVAMAPVVLLLVFRRLPRKAAVGTALTAGLTAAVLLSVLLGIYHHDRTGRLVPIDFGALQPSGDFQPSMTWAGRAGRVGYGFARTFAYLPFHRDLTKTFLAAYAAGLLVLFGAAGHAYRRRSGGSPGAARPVIEASLAVVVPFALIGAYYYPSDPERWLFLMPVVWLWLGLIWDACPMNSGDVARRRWPLFAVVVALGVFNSAAIRRDDAGARRQLIGLRELYREARETDLVISPAGCTGPVYRYFAGPRSRFRNLTLVSLVDHHQGDLRALGADLTAEVDAALGQGRRALVYDLIGEPHVKAEGYPWSHFDHDYGPETFLAVLDRYRARALAPSSARRPGLYQLQAKPIGPP